MDQTKFRKKRKDNMNEKEIRDVFERYHSSNNIDSCWEKTHPKKKEEKIPSKRTMS